MESDKDNIKRIFSSKLSNFEPDLPDSVWNRIDKDLEKFRLTPEVEPKRPVIRKTILFAAGIAAAIAVGVFLLNYNMDTAKMDAELIADRLDVKKEEVKIRPDENNDNLVLNSPNNMIADLPVKKTAVKPVHETKNSGLKYQKAETDASVEVRSTDNTSGLIAENPKPPKEADDNNKEQISKGSFEDFEKDLGRKIAAFENEGNALNEVLADNATGSSVKKKEGFSFGVEAGSGVNKGADAKNQFNTTYNGAQYSGTILLRTQRIRLEHSQPITFGLNISKKLTDKISLESGINYTYLSSRMRSDEESDIQQSDRQYFNYFGIPLSLNYTFAEWKKIKFYTSLGGMIQKDFYGRISSRMHVDGLIGTEEDHKDKISQKNPQFSSMATLGVSYPLYKDIRVYGNLGGAYYFDAKNQYETIYSDKKWMFNMNLGLKFEF